MSSTSPKERLKNDIARGFAAIAGCEERLSALTENERSFSKAPPTKSINLDNLNVFYYASAGNKILLGAVDDGAKFARISLIARD